jgi:hypothetical protein
VICPACPGDVNGIAAVHAGAWQVAYSGILPASTLQAFYEGPGGQPMADRTRDADFDGIDVPEVPYGWEKLPIVAAGDRVVDQAGVGLAIRTGPHRRARLCERRRS